MTQTVLYIGVLFLTGTTVRAGTIDAPCGTAPLSTYEVSGYSCSIGPLDFSKFIYLAINNTPTDSIVRLTPVDDGSDLGFLFTAPFESFAGELSIAVVSYQVSSSSPVLAGNTLALKSYGGSGGGRALIVAGICAAAPLENGACLPSAASSSLDVFYNSGPPVSSSQTESTAFSSPTAFETVTTGILTNGGMGSAGIAQFESTVQILEPSGQAVEAGTMLMIGLGLIGGAIMLHKRISTGP